MPLPQLKNVLPTIKGLNWWTLKQKIKDSTIQRTAPIEFITKIDIYSSDENTKNKGIQKIADPNGIVLVALENRLL
jgi:hypothetical protein